MSFLELLNESGCTLEPIVSFQVEPAIFRRNLSLRLRKQPQLFDSFIEDMQTHTEDPTMLKKCLLPSTLADDVPKTVRTSNIESLFKTLLAIDSIQSDLISYLLERLPEFYDELENDNSSSCTARLILNQLRWLDYISKPEALTGKLIEIIQITPPIIQHEIITSLPDIVNDSEHKSIVVYLKELMSENSDLTVPILDALSNLTLHSENLEDIREIVLDRLESAELDDLAVILRFLLQTVTPTTADMVITGIRHKLDFRTLGKIQELNGSQRQNQQRHTPGSSAKDAPESLILESIKVGLQFHKFVCESWFRSIVALDQAHTHKIIDILVILILYTMPSMKKKAENTLKKKITSGLVTVSLLEESIKYHSSGLAGYWNAILSLSENLLRSCHQNNKLSPCASILYTSAFIACDSYYKQEIIGSLVTHIGSGVETEMNIALNILLYLAKLDVSSVTTYGVFIKGILDYLDNLNLYQIRTLFDVFSLIALTSENTADGSGNLWSDIQIVIRKQLSNPREKYKNIGIIASLSAVRVLGSRERCSEVQQAGGSSSQSGRTSVNRHPLLRQSIGILDSLMRNCNGYPSCISLCYDELAYMFSEGQLDERLEVWIKENLTSDFTEYYLSTTEDATEFIEDTKTAGLNLLPKLQMNIDEEEGVDIAIKMYQLVFKKDLKTKKSMVVPMCSTFNLMQSCEKQLNHGSLEGVNALSGCSVLLFDEQTPSELSNEEINDACDILFYTINWFREVLNSFINAADEDLSQTLLLRLRNILELELRLGDYLKQTPTYAPLEFHNTLSMALKEDTIKSSQILSTEISINGSEEQENPIRPNTKKENKLLSMTFKTVNELRSYMRPFNLQVFEIFKHNSNKLQMTHDEINYILDDLDKKLDIKIVPLPVLPFAKKKTVTENKIPPSNITLLARTDSGNFMRQVVPSLPYILRVLEDLYAELQEKSIDPGKCEGAEKITSAISYIVNALYKLLSWPHISSSDNKDILESIVGSLAERISGESKTRPEAQNRHAFQYLSNYGESMPQSATAVILFKTLLRLIELSNSHTSLRQGALVVATHIVSTPWYDWRDIKKDTEFLVEQTVELSDDPLQVLHELVNNVLPRFESEGILEDHPLLKQDTSVQYYQAIINQIVKSFDLFRNTDREPEITLVQNGRAVKIFERITHYVKVKEQRLLTAVLLKTGKNFIDQFTKHSIPYFSQIFKTYRTNILVILKDLQASTRVLQIICSHVKVLKDISLSAYVPPLKKSLENVIYQVKMLVTRNGIPSSAFFMGALKHRDISGAEISSQIPREEDDDENESAVDEIALSDHEEAEDSPTTDKSTRRNENPNRSPAKRKKTPRVTESRKKQKSDVNIDHRTSSQVPSSSEDEASRSEEEIVRQDSSEENMEADAEGDEILEFDLNSNSVDEESEEERSTLSHPSVKVKNEPEAKKKRLGIGRPKPISHKKAFDLTG